MNIFDIFIAYISWGSEGKQSYVDTNVVRDLPPSALAGKTAIGKLTESDVHKFLEFLAK